MSKHIAVIGSSGGNLYNQGGSDPKAMMKEIFTQADSAGIEVSFIQFIGAEATMDNISMDTKARLYTLEGGQVVCGEAAALKEINQQAAALDEQLAKLIDEGAIDGLVLMSSDPKGVNSKAVAAAARKKIPAVGTGGTSIANTQAAGVRVVSASGTTGTTNRTRAVAFVSALAKEWGLKYMPVIGSSAAGSAQAQGSVFKRINFRGIMMASMPGFIAMALCLALSKIPGLGGLEDVFNTLIGILPVILAAIAAKQVSGLDEVGIVAGVIAGIMSVDGGILGGLIAGFAGMYAIAPGALWFGNLVKTIIEACLTFSPLLAGAVAGLLIWPAIIGGVYHAAILPIVLLEMESTGFSFLSAVDMTGLVMVSAGITLANVLFPRQKSDAAVALPGFLINLGFGTFVEASYPFMFSNKLVFGGAILASTVASALVGLLGVRGTAYVPSVMAPFLANEGHTLQFALCMLVAMALAFVITVVANRLPVKTKE